jgi:hypothetical protein
MEIDMTDDEKTLYERKTIVNSEGCQLPVVLSEAVTLRDQFAMAALPGIVSANWGRVDVDRMDVASWAYGIADAMMEARK